MELPATVLIQVSALGNPLDQAQEVMLARRAGHRLS